MPVSLFLKRLLKRLLKRRPILRRNGTKLGKKGVTEAVDTLKEAYGESAVKPVTICKWMKRFEEERERAKDEARKSSSTPSSDRRTTIWYRLGKRAFDSKKLFGNVKAWR